MSSEFSSHLNVSSGQEGWKESVALDSERFLFYKVRLYGLLLLLKLPKPEFAEDLVTIESLRKEFNIGFRLNHPSIIRYYKFEQNGLYEEFVDGLTLRQIIDTNDNRLNDQGFVRSVASQLFEALAYLHKNGIIHRDIKPENLIIANIGDRLKIIDFGAAESDECDSTPGFTATNLAPEQTDGNATFQTDIYQAGLVVASLANKAGLRRRWNKFISKSTHPDPLRRFQNADEALKAIPTENKERKMMMFGIICVTVSVLMAGYVLLNHFKTTKEEATAVAQPEVPIINAEPEEAEISEKSETPEIKVSSPEPPALKVETAPADNEKERLTKEINQFVTATFASYLKKICDEKPPLDEKGYIENSKMLEFEGLYKEAMGKSLDYGKTLVSKYPKQRDFIEETLYRKIEAVGSVYVGRFYEPNEIATKKLGL